MAKIASLADQKSQHLSKSDKPKRRIFCNFTNSKMINLKVDFHVCLSGEKNHRYQREAVKIKISPLKTANLTKFHHKKVTVIFSGEFL